jgi:hypothetical protein
MLKRIALLSASAILGLTAVACTGAAAQEGTPGPVRAGVEQPGTPGPTPRGVETPVGETEYPTKTEPAPIDDVELIARRSLPPQFAVRIVSGLPSGCAQFEGVSVERQGETIRITVLNRVPDSSEVFCTMIYGTHDETVELGSDFEPGKQYTVIVNGEKTLSFAPAGGE